jgi:hypothetical protein
VPGLKRPPRYRSYLLAFWEERSQDPQVAETWRFSLEDPHTGRRRGFACLADLFAFLEQETAPVDKDRPSLDPAADGEGLGMG